jgi:hypothetical protein
MHIETCWHLAEPEKDTISEPEEVGEEAMEALDTLMSIPDV